MTNLPLTQRLALTEAWQTPVSASSNWTPSTIQAQVTSVDAGVGVVELDSEVGVVGGEVNGAAGGGGGVDSLEGVRDRNVGGAQCA
ncbi:hypothetical protein [uncultured Corynebacterium sp.]|uniref:hypothetical protein n=1 Tax=uncultured Corynebacterium sp. TaxID=159447 RepID=UPI00259B24D2|nr:hypothetical protein [uncultured Corynebacterium sp.]